MGLGVAFSAVSTGSMQLILERFFWYARALGTRSNETVAVLAARGLSGCRDCRRGAHGMTWLAHGAAEGFCSCEGLHVQACRVLQPDQIRDEFNVFPIFSGLPQVSASAGASRASQECYKLVAELEVAMLPTSHRSNVIFGSMDLQAGPNLTSILGLRSRLTLRVRQDLMTAAGDAIGDPLQVGHLK